MSKQFTNLSDLKRALQKEIGDSTREVTEKSFDDLQKNVDHFYDKPGNPKPGNPPPGYDRTGQLAASPQLDGINISGDVAIGQVSINTGTQYWPAGRDTETIYGYAEDGGLLGNGKFWQKTEEDIKKNIDTVFGKRFGS